MYYTRYNCVVEKLIDPEGNNSLLHQVMEVLDTTMESHWLALNSSSFPPKMLPVKSGPKFLFQLHVPVERRDAPWPAEPACSPTV